MCIPSDHDSGESASGSTQKFLKRACDCCRKRKVKCDGESPCGPCRKATIRCAYLQPPKKKGPKGLRSAKVLHALRKIDQSASITPDSPLSPNALQEGVNQWSWSSSASPVALPNTTHFDGQYAKIAPAPHAPYHGHVLPQPESETRPVPHPPNRGAFPLVHSGNYLPTNHSHTHLDTRPIETQPILPRIPNHLFLPYMQLFFDHLFFIMPIIDRQIYLDPHLYDSSTCLTSETYAFLCSLCAATIVQLDAATRVPGLDPLPGRPSSTSEMFIEECLKTRREFDYIGNPTTITVMTSFFIFAYYGNKEQSEKAWHYLQESISFAENLDMDDESTMLELNTVEAQWRRRLYWLLFITERYISEPRFILILY